MLRKTALLVLIILVGWGSQSYATKYAGEFLSLGVGARALGMGSAYTGLADDATASYWNPAGLSWVGERELVLMHAEQFGDIANYDYGAYAQPFGENGTLSLSLVRLSIGDIPVTTGALNDLNGNGVLDPGETLNLDNIKMSSDAQNALYFSYGRHLSLKLKVGGSVKMIYKKTVDNHAWGLGLDVGAIYALSPRLLVGVVLKDATSSPLVWDTEESTTETITPSLRLGFAFTTGAPLGEVTLSGDLNTLFEGRNSAAQFGSDTVSGDLYFGLEYRLGQRVALRLGNQEGDMTYGAGLNVRMFQIDYAFIGHNDLDDTHRLSARIQF